MAAAHCAIARSKNKRVCFIYIHAYFGALCAIAGAAAWQRHPTLKRRTKIAKKNDSNCKQQ